MKPDFIRIFVLLEEFSSIFKIEELGAAMKGIVRKRLSAIKKRPIKFATQKSQEAEIHALSKLLARLIKEFPDPKIERYTHVQFK